MDKQKLVRIGLGIFFAVLLIVAIVEVFLIFSSKSKNSDQNFSAESNRSVGSKQPPGQDIAQGSENQNSNIVTTIFRGEVIDINTSGGVAEQANFNYDASISIRDEAGIEGPIYFVTEELEKATIVENVNGNENDIEFGEIGIGDFITIESTTDKTKDYYSNTLGLKIIVTK